jgi:hydrogenase nickel incorporation protein HypA/HybF
MHELTLALSLLEEVESVRLRLGRMSGIVRDALLFSWELARADTVASEAELIIDDVAVEVWCTSCAAERPVSDGQGLICAQCGTVSPTIVRGRELEFVAMEVA